MAGQEAVRSIFGMKLESNVSTKIRGIRSVLALFMAGLRVPGETFEPERNFSAREYLGLLYLRTSIERSMIGINFRQLLV